MIKHRLLGLTLRLSNSGLKLENLHFSQISSWCWCFWPRDHTWRAIGVMFYCFYICFLLETLLLTSCDTLLVCLLPYWLFFSVFPSSSPVCVRNEVLQSLVLGPQYLHTIFWWSHPVEWPETPPKCRWPFQVLISFLTFSWLVFLLSFLISPPRYLMGILNFVWLKQNSVLFKRKIYLLRSLLSFIKLLLNLDVIIYSSLFLFTYSACIQQILLTLPVKHPRSGHFPALSPTFYSQLFFLASATVIALLPGLSIDMML